MMYSGEEMSIGATNITTAQNARLATSLPLCFENRKKASPTIPYSFTNVPSMITKAAQKSFSFSVK